MSIQCDIIHCIMDFTSIMAGSDTIKHTTYSNCSYCQGIIFVSTFQITFTEVRKVDLMSDFPSVLTKRSPLYH